MSPPEIASDSNSPSDAPLAERGVAARAHLCAWLSVLPLLGLFASVGIYNRRQRYSPWVGQQALQAALFQVLMFNLLLVVLGLVIPIALVAWQSVYGGGDLVVAALLTAAPFVAVHYCVQGVWATRAARAVHRGEGYRYPYVGRLLGGGDSARAEREARARVKRP